MGRRGLVFSVFSSYVKYLVYLLAVWMDDEWNGNCNRGGGGI